MFYRPAEEIFNCLRAKAHENARSPMQWTSSKWQRGIKTIHHLKGVQQWYHHFVSLICLFPLGANSHQSDDLFLCCLLSFLLFSILLFFYYYTILLFLCEFATFLLSILKRPLNCCEVKIFLKLPFFRNSFCSFYNRLC